jgi:hypothetical protein
MKNRIVLGGISVLFVLAIWWFFIKVALPHTLGNLGDLRYFPFKADVWGSFADWIMVGVTGLTAFFLYQTLKSQNVVQNAQLILTRIELDKHRILIMPVFETKMWRFDQLANESRLGNYHGMLGFSNKTAYPAQDVVLKISDVPPKKDDVILQKNIKSLPRIYGFIDVKLEFHKPLNQDKLVYKVELEFNDKLNNRYTQTGFWRFEGYPDINNTYSVICELSEPVLIRLAL